MATPAPTIASNDRGFRIAVTGGPGGGKTTAADLFRRELGERVVVVPEAATLLFAGGFPRHKDPEAMRATQRAIFEVQRALEDTQAANYRDRILLCDRGTLDGAAYWPEGNHDFFTAMGTTHQQELSRYDAVIFFESAAVAGIGIEGGNPTRVESMTEAAALDARIREVWQAHRRFYFVPNNLSFFKKITMGLATLEGIVGQLGVEIARSA